MENNVTIREMRDKIEQLNFRLSECKNENQILKRNLHLAKKMVYKEIGANCLDFQEIYKHGSESGQRNRAQIIILLKNKVQELQKYLNRVESNTSVAKLTSSEDITKELVDTDKKEFYRTHLERRLAKETAESDMNPLLEEIREMMKALVAEKKRFRELKEEMNLLRAQFDSQINKNKEDTDFNMSFQTIESQLQETLAERAEIRRELIGSRTQNIKLEEKITALKSELQANDKNILIDSYRNKQIQKDIDGGKLVAQQNMDRYREELQELSENYEKNVALLNSLRDKSLQWSLVLTELDKEIKSGFLMCVKNINEECLSFNIRKNSSLSSNSSFLSEVETKKDAESVKVNNSGLSLMNQKLRMDIEKYKKLLEASHIDKERLFHITRMQDKQMNNIAQQVVETGRMITQNTVEKNMLEEKLSRFQKTLSSKSKKENVRITLNNQLEEMQIRIGGRKEEHEFMRNILLTVVASLTNDFFMYKGFLYETKMFFAEAFENILRNFKKQKKTLHIIS